MNPDDTKKQMLVICSSKELAMGLVYQFELMSMLKELKNDREFVWLLRSIKKPVTQVAFDPQPQGEEVNAVEIVEIDELLSNRLSPDMSPWNYPVYVVAQEQGFVSIESPDETGEMIMLLCLFTEKRLAADYLDKSGSEGEFCAFHDVGEARTFFESLDRSLAAAVALDPEIDEGTHKAKYCFSIEVLLEKYLVGGVGEE